MKDLNFSEKKIDDEHEKFVVEKTTKIMFDYDQLDFIKFRLSFMDGFNFGLGIIVVSIMVLLILFLIVMNLGFSFSNILLNSLM